MIVNRLYPINRCGPQASGPQAPGPQAPGPQAPGFRSSGFRSSGSGSPTHPPGLGLAPASSRPPPPQKIKRIIFYQYKKPIDTILFL